MPDPAARSLSGSDMRPNLPVRSPSAIAAVLAYVEQARQDAAAVLFQAASRARSGRRSFLSKRDSAIMLQSAFRGAHAAEGYTGVDQLRH